ncbi:MAG TPA: hypothetical protein DHW82_00585 [Spirochaetia bacterium]|nr:MAG: hypothetical protein A2Y41_06615 [Spirochaetes bacterium GWB1_36_13]HCL55496.1 hypothetical protein [Spirochaetia bacterium]
MQIQRYEKYKASGIDWLGEMPEGWEVKRLKDVISSNEKSLSNNEDPFLEIKYIDISNVGTDKLNDKPEVFYFQDAPSRARRIPRKNDVILSTVRTYLKAVYFFENIEENTICSTGFSVLTPKRILPFFLKYSVIGESFIDNVIKYSKGVSYPAINDSELTALPLFLPNKQTQTAIANYLDQHTALIDKKIALLKVKKQSYTQLKQTLINEVVTKGLDKTVEMKDSGIEWIGQIPKHWEVKRLKDEFNLLSSGIKNFTGNKEYLSTASIGENEIISVQETITYDERPSRANMQPRINTAWFAKMKDTNKSYIFSNKEECEKYILSTGFCAFDVNKNHLSFIKYYLISGYFIFEKDMYSYGTTQFSINDTNISQIKFIKLPKSEQIAIANYLDEKTSKIDQIVKKIDENILALQEFRKILINDVVTGKVKVL